MSIEPVGDDNLISFWQDGKPALEIGFKLSKSDVDALREHDRKTRKVEQNRIIELLEDHFDDTALWRQIQWSPDVYEGFNKQELIELIKGQNK